MSPEQIEGKPVDARSDVFSLGILLCEMATGTRPFDGDSAVGVMSSILKDTPPTVTELRAELPEALSQLVVPSARLREALGDYAPDIARLTPELQHRFPDLPEPAELPPEARRRYLFNGLLELLRNLSRDRPYGAAAGRSAVGGRCEPGARRARRVAPGEHAGRDRRHLS